MSISIIKPGVSSSIQDLGRWGYQEFGVPIGGAMDQQRAVTANRLCGNDDNAAVIECTLHGLEIQLNETVCLSLSGGGANAKINGIEVAYNRSIKVIAGSVLKLHPDTFGCRTYIAFAGGIKCTKELGSSSTYVASSLGGVGGRNLLAGDELFINTIESATSVGSSIVIDENGFGMSKWKAQTKSLPHVNDTVEVKCVPGPEWELFDEVYQQLLLKTIFTIAPQSNRMGYRLEGNKLNLKEKVELISTAVTRGIVQVTNEGNPVILMADAQTIGGYPRIARIKSDDINLLAQCRPGVKVTFLLVLSYYI